MQIKKIFDKMPTIFIWSTFPITTARIRRINATLPDILLLPSGITSSYNSIRLIPAHVVKVTLVRCKHESN